MSSARSSSIGEPKEAHDENDQDIEILDSVFAYIEKAHSSSFINNDTIMFSIEDVMALVDRYLRENTQTYTLKDLKKEKSPPK